MPSFVLVFVYVSMIVVGGEKGGRHTLHVEPGFGDLGGYATQFRPSAPFPAAVLVEVHPRGGMSEC